MGQGHGAVIPVTETTRRGRNTRSRSAGRLLVTILLLLVMATGIVGARIVIGGGDLTRVNPFAPHAGPSKVAPAMPTNHAIEDAWGIRFISVNLLADGGIVEARYEVIDGTNGGRIHRGTGVENLPALQVEGTSKVVKSEDLMFHIHHGATHDEGRSYSIVYGNAGNAVKPGSKVTIHMVDGLDLTHVPVSV